VFLLQAQPRANAVVAQVVIQGALLGREPVQVKLMQLLADPSKATNFARSI